MSKIWMIGLLFLLGIGMASAVSNVQHSFDGTKMTITYEGTPPFVINIRGDTNIGQAGGYVWAKTNSNSFTYDMSFADSPSGNFYFGVKDTAWSTAQSFHLGAVSQAGAQSASPYAAQVYLRASNGSQYLSSVELKRVPSSGCLENAYVVISRDSGDGKFSVPCMDKFFYDPVKDAEKFSLVSAYYYADYLQEYHRDKMGLTLPKLGVYLKDPPASDPTQLMGYTVGLTGIEMYPTVPFLDYLLEHEFAHFVQHNIFYANHPTSCEDANSAVSSLFEGHARYLPAFFTNNPVQQGYNLSSTMNIQFPVPKRDACEDTTACGKNLLFGIAGFFWEVKTYYESKYADGADRANKVFYTAWKEITFDKEPMTELLIALANADRAINTGADGRGENEMAIAEIFIKHCPDCGVSIVNGGVRIPNYVPNEIPVCAPK
jgi:hypothetical protein